MSMPVSTDAPRDPVAMDAVEALVTRRSANRLTEPPPPAELVDLVLHGALRAPDHGRLTPWKFVLISGEARRRFGDVLAESLARRQPDASAASLEREREKALRAPLVMVVAARVNPQHPKIPEIEQVMSAAAAAENIMLGFHARGFGVMWRTGEPAYDRGVKAALGLMPTDHIVGFLYIGTALGHTPSSDLALADFVETWSGPASP
jgi:nitroreductase